MLNPIPTPEPDHYRTIPALAAYIDRIGAEQRNFKRFVVKQRSPIPGQYFFEAVIRLSSDGTVEVDDAALAPTPDEQTAIKAAFANVAIPQSVKASKAQAERQRRHLQVAEANWYELVALQDRTQIVMCQQRIQVAGEKKIYVPWTLFSDGQWRKMEPDGKLPFWKPARQHGGGVMLHEGAKPARFCDWLCNSNHADANALLRAHPWAESLKYCEHWGWIGGALNHHRTNWDELRSYRPNSITYVCDNDSPGMAAMRAIAKKLKDEHLSAILFNDEFPISFDLADNLPTAMFKDGDYIGPDFNDLKRSAIWATEQLPHVKGMPPTYKLRQKFLDEWGWSIQPQVFVNKSIRRAMLTKDQFNQHVRPFSDVENTARLLQLHGERQANAAGYKPGRDTFFYNEDGQRLINTWMAANVKASFGDAGPWIEFMTHLFPIPEERNEMLKWCATLIAKLEVKMLYGVLMIQEVQGVGKSTLMEKVLLPLVGKHNCSAPSEADIADSQFNYWRVNTRLAIIHEIYAGQNRKVYNKLKSVITDKDFWATMKYLAPYYTENWTHVIAASNSIFALQLAMDDRRWFVPQVTDVIKPQEYWIGFNTWLAGGGLGSIRQWAIGYVTTHGAVLAGAHAPMSAMKEEIIEASMTEGHRLLIDLANEARKKQEPIFMTDRDIREWLAQMKHTTLKDQHLESLAIIRNVMCRHGLAKVGNKAIHGIRHHWLANQRGQAWLRDKPKGLDTDGIIRTEPTTLVPLPAVRF